MVERSTPRYEIRGHHLELYADFVASGLEPMQFAAIQAASTIDRMLTSSNPLPGYYPDLWGSTVNEFRCYIGNLAEVYKQFLDLDKKEQVGLVIGKPDAVCRACTGAGEHCRLRSQARFGGLDVLDGDEFYRNELFTAAEEIGTIDKIHVVDEETLEFTDAPAVAVSRMAMPAGALKETLLFMASQKER